MTGPSAGSDVSKAGGFASSLTERLKARAGGLLILKRRLEEGLSSEIEFFRGFVGRYPFLSVGISLLAGLLIGAILSARISQFILMALIGGFPLAIVYGNSLGVPAEASCASVVLLHCFMLYAALRILPSLRAYPRLAPHISALMGRYRSGLATLPMRANGLQAIGAMAVSSFLIGWWASAMLALLLGLSARAALCGAALGLMAAAAISLLLYKGLIMAIPDAWLVGAIFLAIFFISAVALRRIAPFGAAGKP
jgi:ElaB/YqjD/DUF883 family membrane-anchored ribosome-binding protein